MQYRGKIDQVTIFGQVEFIEDEVYTNKASTEKGYVDVSGRYKIVDSDEVVELSLAFYSPDLNRHTTH